MAGQQGAPASSSLPSITGPLRQMVEQLLGLALDQAALLLDHEDALEPAQRLLQAPRGSSGQVMPTL